MLPNHEELVRAMAQRTSTEAERAGRDRQFHRDHRDRARVTDVTPSRDPRPDADCRPCPERATGLA